jgi:hypothetical protein
MSGNLVPAFLLVALVAGCGRSGSTTATIPTPDELTLYAIDGVVDEPPGGSVSDAKYFRGYEIMGKVEITDPKSREEIMAAVQAGITEGKSTSPASCFWPRHGVHVVIDGKAVDYVICYECHQAYIYSGADKAWELTTSTHQALLTDRLTAAGIKLAPSIEEKFKANSAKSN